MLTTITAISCGWCHQTVYRDRTHCPRCGHEVWRDGRAVARLQCSCLQCQRRAGVGVPSAADQEAILGELDEAFRDSRKERGIS